MTGKEVVRRVIGVDLGDCYSYIHELDGETGETLSQTRIPTAPLLARSMTRFTTSTR